MAAETVPLAERLATLRHLKRLFAQIWRASPYLMIATIVLRLMRAVQPLLVLYIGKLIIDEVVRQTGLASPGPAFADWLSSGRLVPVARLLALELALVIAADLLARAVSAIDGIMAELHSNRLSMELMQHAAGLDLRHFESSDYQDRLERARRQAAGRNQLLSQVFGQGQAIITVLMLAAGLFVYAPWLILLLLLSLLPAVLNEVKFNTPRLFSQPGPLSGAARARISALYRRQRRKRERDKAVRAGRLPGRAVQAAG